MPDDRAEALRRWAAANGYGAATCGPLVLDIETTGKTPWTGDLLCVGIGEDVHHPEAGRLTARQLLARPGVVVCHTGFDLRWLCLDGAELHDELEFHDTRVMAWLIGVDDSLALDDLCDHWLGYRPEKHLRQAAGRVMFESPTVGLVPIAEAPWDELAAYNLSDIRATAELYARLRAELEEQGLWAQFLRDEVPLVRAILEMEVAGLPFDEAARQALRDRVQGERDTLEAKLRESAGLPASFNLGSGKQVGAYLFGWGDVELPDRLELDPAALAVVKAAKAAGHGPLERLNASGLLPAGFAAERLGRLYAHGRWTIRGRACQAPEETATGQPSTGSIPLVLSNPRDEWVADFVLWRELTKLDSAFLATFPDYVGPDGRLHGTLNRTGTATGRLSSSEPNLQNIPAHGSYGAHVRALFRGDLVVGDYSQLEQRVAAHFSQDENLLKAYHDGVDLYGLAAAILFGGEASKKHPQRGLMKTGMLALQYGAGAGKLAQLMLVDGHADATRAGAQRLIEQLQDVFPRFFAWREEVIAEAAERGYVETLAGRRRRLRFPTDWNRMRRRRFFKALKQEEVSRGFSLERQAVNTICQGGAADIVAAAMVESRRVLGDRARLLLQVHDEILWERGLGWDAEALAEVRYACEVGHGFDLNVPLEFDAKEVTTWAEKGGGASGMSSLFSERQKRSRSEGMQSRKASDLARAAS